MSSAPETITAAPPSQQQTGAANSGPPAQAPRPPPEYIKPYATAGYKPVYTSPPPPITLIPPGAVMIRHVNIFSNQRRKWGRRRGRRIGPNGSGILSQLRVRGAMPQSFSPPLKQTEARPPVGEPSNKKHLVDVAGSPGGEFIPHFLTVQPGEDVSLKIMAFAHSAPRAICVLSGTGAVASVALNTSGGTMTYEGRFEIMSLSGSFVPSEHKSRRGGLAITLGGPQGRAFGGRVSGFLIAATPVQVIVGSFKVQDC